MIHYSKRLPATFTANEHAILLKQHRQTGTALIDLTVSNPTQTIADYPHAKIGAALGSIRNFSYAPEAFGIPSAREAIAGLYQARGFDTSIDRIALTASTSEAYSILFKLLCDPGDEILVPVPSYPLFEHLAIFDSVQVRPYPLRYDGAWHIDFEALTGSLSSHTRAVVIVNPNNPTGSFLKMNEARRLLAWASDRHLPIISDEVFLDYKWSADPAIVDTLCAFPEILSFSLGGLSKSAAMPQMKLGWIVVNGPQSELEQLWPRLDLILDTYLSVNWPVQSALASFLTIGRALREQLSDTIRTNLASLHSEVANTPLHVLNTEGGWTAILQLPRICSEQEWINDLLRHESILVQPGYFFDMPTEPYIVISLITPAATFNTGLQHLVHYVRERTN